jgi:hypothetical protein
MALTGGGKDSVHTVSMKYKTSLSPDTGKSWHKKNLTAAEKTGSCSCYSGGKKNRLRRPQSPTEILAAARPFGPAEKTILRSNENESGEMNSTQNTKLDFS